MDRDAQQSNNRAEGRRATLRYVKAALSTIPVSRRSLARLSYHTTSQTTSDGFGFQRKRIRDCEDMDGFTAALYLVGMGRARWGGHLRILRIGLS